VHILNAVLSLGVPAINRDCQLDKWVSGCKVNIWNIFDAKQIVVYYQVRYFLQAAALVFLQ